MTVVRKINEDLLRERTDATFDVREFANWFHDGAEKLQLKRLIEEELYVDVDDAHEIAYQSYEDTFNAAVKQAVDTMTKVKKLQQRLGPNETEMQTALMGPAISTLTPLGNPLVVHLLMFVNALKSQGTDEQYAEYRERAENYGIIGTYAQTELGHGTFLRGLETRADYDRATQEFVLNTNTLTAYKWWPGGLGHVANYCIVMAQLYIDNQPKGVQLFVLQVRNEQTHVPLPGIDVGEIGKKIGMLGLNNGYLGLKNVRIPRKNMLMRNAQVLPDGTFVQGSVSQLNYFPMVYVRCVVVMHTSTVLLQAATIATRYSAVRRQSPINPNEPEVQILDHVTQQMKLLSEVAVGLAYRLAGKQLSGLYQQTYADIAAGDYARLPELHALSCTLKASCALDATFGVERLRLACGGHGYLAAANLGNLFTNIAAACTYEGEVTVLYLQVGKILMKTWHDLQMGKQLMPTMSYLAEFASWTELPKWDRSWQCMVRALQYVATDKVRTCYKHLSERLAKGQTQQEALNHTGIELTQAAELHGRAFVAHNFHTAVTGATASHRSPQLNLVLGQLLELYLVHNVQRHLADILRCIHLSANEVATLQGDLEMVLGKLRTNAVAICDGFDFHDHELNSVLGCYDGNVYERIFEAAKKSPLNRQTVPKAFELYLKPFMKSKL